MNWIDIVICIPLLWGIWRGFTKGLVIEVASLIALGLGIWGGIHLSDYTANFLVSEWGWETEYMPIVAFALTFLLIVVGIFLGARLLEKVVDMVALKLANKVAGAVFGMLKVGLILSILLIVVESIDSKFEVLPQDQKSESYLYGPIMTAATVIIPGFKESDVFGTIDKAKDSLPATGEPEEPETETASL